MNLDYFLKLFLSGLTRGSIYALLALGYTMVYGIIQLINFAHGEIYMISAFIALTAGIIAQILGFSKPVIFFTALFFAVIYAAAYSYAVEKVAYKPLRNSPRLSALISAIGMSIFLQNYVRLAQTSDFLTFPSLIPDFNFLKPVSHVINTGHFVILLSTVIVMTILTLLIKFTRIGKAMRAVSQDQIMALLTGVNINHIISITFVIGAATAAIGAVLISSYIGQINFYIGFMAGIKAFVAAVLGGIGSIPGAVLGSFILEFFNL